jgi:hypothetical protein
MDSLNYYYYYYYYYYISISNVSTGTINPLEASRFVLSVLSEPYSKEGQGFDGESFPCCVNIY